MEDTSRQRPQRTAPRSEPGVVVQLHLDVDQHLLEVMGSAVDRHLDVTQVCGSSHLHVVQSGLDRDAWDRTVKGEPTVPRVAGSLGWNPPRREAVAPRSGPGRDRLVRGGSAHRVRPPRSSVPRRAPPRARTLPELRPARPRPERISALMSPLPSDDPPWVVLARDSIRGARGEAGAGRPQRFCAVYRIGR